MTSQPRPHRDGWLVLSALVGAGLALPVAQGHWHGPDIAATLAVAAICRLAGHRWAVAVIVLADLLLLPTVWPRVVLGPGGLPRLVAAATLFAILPGVRALPHAIDTLTAMAGRTGTEQMYRYAHVAVICIGAFALLAPIL